MATVAFGGVRASEPFDSSDLVCVVQSGRKKEKKTCHSAVPMFAAISKNHLIAQPSKRRGKIIALRLHLRIVR